MTEEHYVELTGRRFNEELRWGARPELAPLLAEAEEWLRSIVEPLGLTGRNVTDGLADLRSVRWFDAGQVEVEVYLVNVDGNRYAVGPADDRRPATRWVPAPIPPPDQLRELA